MYALCYNNKEEQNHGLVHREHTIHKQKSKLKVALWCYGQRFMAEAVKVKNIPKRKKCKKAKWLSEEALQIAEKRSERRRIKGRIYPSE